MKQTQTIQVGHGRIFVISLNPSDIRIDRDQSDETGDVYSSISALGAFVGYYNNDITEEQAIAQCEGHILYHPSKPATGIFNKDGLQATLALLAKFYRSMAENCEWQANHRVKVCSDYALCHRGTHHEANYDTKPMIAAAEKALSDALPLKG